MQDDISQIKSWMQQQNSVLDAHTTQINRIESEITRYKGFRGGVIFLLSGLVAAFELGKDWLLQHIK